MSDPIIQAREAAAKAYDNNGWFSFAEAIRNASWDHNPCVQSALLAIQASSAETDRLREALVRADRFITNGIEFGFIRMPESITDAAHETPHIIRAALASLPASEVSK